MTRIFKCQECGHCCERIVVKQHDITMGLCMYPGEETLFASFSDAVIPCIGIKRPGRSRIKTVSYQMIKKPCPHYDQIMKRCTVYEHRPISCRSYPFSFLSSGGHSVESTCSWAKAQQDVRYGKTVIQAGSEQNLAAEKVVRFFVDLRSRMNRTGYTIMLMYDVESMDWVEPVRG